jgi:hypothetical protein
MQTLLSALVILWLARLAGEVLIGIIQIILGLTAGIIGLGLWGLSICMETLQKLLQTSLSK